MLTEKFKTSTIFDLQQELLRTRKEFTIRQDEWKKERISLIQKNEIINMELIQLKHREMNLKKINDALQLAQFQSKTENVASSIMNEIHKIGKSTKDDQFLKNKYEDEFRDKQQELRQEYEKQMEELKEIYQRQVQKQLRNQQKSIKRQLSYEISQLQSQNDDLRNQIHDLSSQLQSSNLEVSQLRQQVQISSIPCNSFRSSNSNRFMNFINNSKQTHQVNTSNIVSQMLCEVCGEVFSNNDFFDHIQQCQKQEQQNYEDLLSRKRQIQNQLQMLDYRQPVNKPNKIIMIVNDTSRGNKKDKSFKKSYKNSPSNSLIQNSFKSSVRRY